MSNTKHTDGPWVVEPRAWDQGASLAIVAPSSGFIVAIIPFDEDIQTVDEPDGETVARHPDEVPNANLVAAAPDLLAALKAQEMADADPEASRRKGYYERARELRSAALAKAEGRA